jgi:hypothetical protein
MIHNIKITFKDKQIIRYNSHDNVLNYEVENECLQVMLHKQAYKLTNFYPLDTIMMFEIEHD